ncbi:MAG: hypothetical protein GIX01_01590 [Candidatus Eremiobacteraeota bacterium]|nr:hypothetical protein [Candidatus Eremiobacteraeota bacterium]
MSSSVSSRRSDVVSMLLVDASEDDYASIAPHLGAYPLALLDRLVDRNCRVRPLRDAERYRDASPALRRLGVDVDAWPVPPAGLFVVEERTVYLRSRTAMTIGHEVAHAIDCALGDGVYRSGFDPRIRAAFAGARAFVTPYAASGLDEYFAECVRAYADAFHDAGSPWPRATRERLRSCDPAMHAIVAELFAS